MASGANGANGASGASGASGTNGARGAKLIFINALMPMGVGYETKKETLCRLILW